MQDETSYIRLMAPITPLSTERLLQVIDQKYKSGVRKIHLLLSTPGGSVAHGIAIYNFLKGVPLEVVTHNFGTVDSIGIIVFCAGSRRLSVPNARFLLHPVGMNVHVNTNFDEHRLLEISKSLKIDQENISKIIAITTKQESDKILGDIHDRNTLNPDEAKQYGLVDEIVSELLPLGADFVLINESEARNAQHGVQIPTGLQGVAIPPNDANSSIYELNAVSTIS